MRIACVSDTHNRHPDPGLFAGADLIVHAGDATGRGTHLELVAWIEWLRAVQRIAPVVAVPGNHDFGLDDRGPRPCRWAPLAVAAIRALGVALITDTDQVETVAGLRVAGGPWTNLGDWAFGIPDASDRAERWSRLPPDIDLLLTHAPAYGRLDRVSDAYPHVGDPTLAAWLREASNVGVGPHLHIHGHIHESRGIVRGLCLTRVNAACLDGDYRPWQATPDHPAGPLWVILDGVP